MREKLIKIYSNPKIKLFLWILFYYFFIIYISLIINNLRENKFLMIDGKPNNIEIIYTEPMSANLNLNISF